MREYQNFRIGIQYEYSENMALNTESNIEYLVDKVLVSHSKWQAVYDEPHEVRPGYATPHLRALQYTIILSSTGH